MCVCGGGGGVRVDANQPRIELIVNNAQKSREGGGRRSRGGGVRVVVNQELKLL